MYNRFTVRARLVMQLAAQEATRFNHEYVGTEHILLGLIREGAGVAVIALRNLNIDSRAIRVEVARIVQPAPEAIVMGPLPLTPGGKRVIEYAIEEARNHNFDYVGTEHLLVGLLREEEGVAAQVLQELGLRADPFREEVFHLLDRQALGTERPTLHIPQDQMSELPGEVQEQFDDLDAQIENINQQKEAAVAERNFERAAHLRDQADKLKKEKTALLRQWHIRYVIEPGWLLWNDGAVIKIADTIAAEKRWKDLPILADALEEAGCTDAEMLTHCRRGRAHGSGCWVVNLLRATT
jgi:ATP-dependent Clp protease ATP-binding subunit ClpA